MESDRAHLAWMHANRKGRHLFRIPKRTGIPDYRSIPGNLAVHILRRDEGNTAHFYTFTLWDSLEAIQKFAGSEIEKAKYYPEDREFLLEFEPNVTHWNVTGSAEK
jgi:heme-degrading monooxygenase HmoA